MAKVICVDNFNRECHPDSLYKNGLSDEDAKALASELNSKEHEDSPRFYRAVPDDHKLYDGDCW